jgi:hypothetical protein
MLAVGDARGTLRFYAQGAGDETASLVPSKNQENATETFVEVISLDEFFEGRIVEIDMLKVDAEGYDFRVLLGAAKLLSLGAIRTLQFEYNAPWKEAGSTLVQAVSYLKSFGYETFILKGNALYSFDPEDLGEYFRYTNLVAFRPGSHILDAVPKQPIF